MFTRKQILEHGYRRHPYNRIFDRVKRTENGCLEFQGGLDIHGYGKIKIKGHNIGAHKVSYILCKGDVEEGMVVMHSCDNPRCVNPDHLFKSTQKENILDAQSKNRLKTGLKNGFIALSQSKSQVSFFYPSIRGSRKDGFSRGVVPKKILDGKPYRGFILLSVQLNDVTS